jgi:hypothetical protein
MERALPVDQHQSHAKNAIRRSNANVSLKSTRNATLNPTSALQHHVPIALAANMTGCGTRGPVITKKRNIQATIKSSVFVSKQTHPNQRLNVVSSTHQKSTSGTI